MGGKTHLLQVIVKFLQSRNGGSSGISKPHEILKDRIVVLSLLRQRTTGPGWTSLGRCKVASAS